MRDFLFNLKSQIIQAAPQLITGVLTFIGFWIAAAVLDKVIQAIGRNARIDKNIVKLLGRCSRIVLIILGLVSALGTIGINVSAVVASLGLTGFALGFALKDGLSNMLAGILILIYKPFKIGNKIRVTGYEGEIVDIDLRYTILLSEGKMILMPNSNLFSNPVEILLPAV